MIETLHRKLLDRHAAASSWKAEGRRVAGWICTYVPEEIFWAAGILPVRVLGGDYESTPLGDAYLYTNLCPYVRSCAEAALNGEYAYLDCFVATNTCDSIRRLYDVWKHYVRSSLPIVLSVPVRCAPTNVRFYRCELERLKHETEETFGLRVSNDAIREAISVYNRTRRLLRRLYDFRSLDSPPITGAETLTVLLTGLVIPKPEYNRLLAELLPELESRSERGSRDKRVRLFLMGSELDKPEYVEVIESLGAVVVGDDLCNGERYFWGEVAEDRDPLTALAERYLTRLPCPRMEPAQRRLDLVCDLVRRQRAQGVIYAEMQFCDLHGGTFPEVREALAAAGIPTLKVERDYVLSGVGQLKTRVQAFLERIRADL